MGSASGVQADIYRGGGDPLPVLGERPVRLVLRTPQGFEVRRRKRSLLTFACVP